MLQVFENVKNPKLKGLIVWVPMVPGDSALEATGLLSPEKRLVMQSWDSQRGIGQAMARTLRLGCPAWDVYLVYKTGVQWIGETPPMPSFWMHQLHKKWGADPALHLQPEKLLYEVRKALGEQVGTEPAVQPTKCCQ